MLISTIKPCGLYVIIDSSKPEKPASSRIPSAPISLKKDKSLYEILRSPNTRGETSTMTSNPSECAYSLISVNSFFISSAGLFTDNKHEKILEKPNSLVFFR